jgi:hypothetical protein
MAQPRRRDRSRAGNGRVELRRISGNTEAWNKTMGLALAHRLHVGFVDAAHPTTHLYRAGWLVSVSP